MQDVLKFWFETIDRKEWYKSSEELDTRIRNQFDSTYSQIVAGETSSWRQTPEGRLAEIIVLDQFGRNMYRGTPKPFIYDALALALSQEAVRTGVDQLLNETQRMFLYMPYMHSESRQVHEEAMRLFKDLPNFEYEVGHKKIIDQFGRYPYRNEVMGRQSTAEEIEWMKENKGY